MSQPSARDELEAIRSELKIAAETIIEAALASMEILADLRQFYPVVVPQAEIQLSKILEAASFQDITGQRLTNIEKMVAGVKAPQPANGEVCLENGPALAGQGLAQADADALMSGLV